MYVYVTRIHVSYLCCCSYFYTFPCELHSTVLDSLTSDETKTNGSSAAKGWPSSPRPAACRPLLRSGQVEAFDGGERVAEVAAVAVGTDLAGEHHAADLGLVARVADDGAELGDAVSELALVAVGARPRLLPLVAQLRLEHALVVHLQLHADAARRRRRRRVWRLLGFLAFLVAAIALVHALLIRASHRITSRCMHQCQMPINKRDVIEVGET